MNSIENEKIAIITVLGRKDDEVYKERISHAIKLASDYIDLFDSIHLIVKWYKDSEWSYEAIKKLVEKLNNKKIVLHKDKETEYYRLGNFSFDTIEEAAMLRISIEKLFKDRKVYLTVVTSEIHSKRSDFIFKSLFEDLKHKKNLTSIIIPYNPSPNLIYINFSNNSAKELNKASQIQEIRTFNRLLNESKIFKDFLQFYQHRTISFTGKFDQSGKIELMTYIE